MSSSGNGHFEKNFRFPDDEESQEAATVDSVTQIGLLDEEQSGDGENVEVDWVRYVSLLLPSVCSLCFRRRRK